MPPPIERSLQPKRFGRNPPRERNEAIARLAHHYWEEREKTHQPGSDLEDWLRAEADYIKAREAAIDESSEESFPASDPPAR